MMVKSLVLALDIKSLALQVLAITPSLLINTVSVANLYESLAETKDNRYQRSHPQELSTRQQLSVACTTGNWRLGVVLLYTYSYTGWYKTTLNNCLQKCQCHFQMPNFCYLLPPEQIPVLHQSVSAAILSALVGAFSVFLPWCTINDD